MFETQIARKMPPKKVTVKTGVGSTPNIMVLLNKSAAAATAVNSSEVLEKKSESVDTKSDFLVHEDPLIQEYYNTLSPNERIAHTIAKEKLGTSYDVSRTHGFLRWQKTRK
jgi:hypothetical protein